MHFDQLTRLIGPESLLGHAPTAELTGVCCDSRQAGPGMVFVAVVGHSADGHAYVAAAAAAGATAAVVQRPVEADIAQIVVPDSRLALSALADEFAGRPSQRLKLVGVTGTNGKTTICHLARAIMAQRWPTGMIGTVETCFAQVRRPAAMTTPDAVTLQKTLAEMLANGVEAAAMEVSSHALDQHRADHCRFDVGLFTNLSRDHLDYHPDMADYFRAKRLLFTELLPWSARQGKRPVSVICLDDDHGRVLADQARGTGLALLTYGLAPGADVGGRVLAGGVDGMTVRIDHPGGSLEFHSRLVGRYNLQNIVGAAAVGLALGLSPEEIKAGLEGVAGVPGRLQRVPGPDRSPAVFVDYAHSPEAIAAALAVLRPLCAGRLICVFGAGGDRDKGKRPLMGRAAGQAADFCVLTSDNPRTEDPMAIIDMVEAGLVESEARRCDNPAAGQRAYAVEADRAAAIAMAIQAAGPADVVLIAGKGHEDYQIIGRVKRHFDDREQALTAMTAKAARLGEQ
ncbi:UDP-N-acetylmuramyl-tripeptide synthetase [Desulfarculus baarsii DSM 2075]|uniref:UDP-N-acetylmuramoyl-L-alanyl-D-glutamate--2,6-diaminopimelate ligase n=1 Tax=Desulfarculus baarsii (strain ATCC 33931 / DSM 2075 / LMG 7858 / VKM B-1802 / 2st14) TaxID=644282 RepID=E1QM99_DESB2|nr:UDP-N-acetylmuramoyl-L-alanyl-D-glutamate--2,6-diaminopimelate ligase [Desulfarculus baarsii]ADK86142.1 UDP-N-acetylmuramyl-tripeptide synthetase [Desulfarculus baarsii DSM 2075]